MPHPDYPRPAVRRTGGSIVPHPAWTDALGEILRRAAEGPGTILLVGPPGTGKSVMLRQLAALLGNERIPVTTVPQGDLPFLLQPAGVLLIDEAWRMPADQIRALSSQRQGIAVLADTDRLAAASLGSAARVVRLRPLTEAESHAFAADWLQQVDASAVCLTPDAIARVAVHASGAVRLIVQLLTAAIAVVASAGHTEVDAADVDHAATMRRNWMVAPDPASASDPTPVPAAAAPARRRFAATRRARRSVAVAAMALAACLVLAWQLRPDDLMVPRGAVQRADLLPIQAAQTPAATLATTSQPNLARLPAVGPAVIASAPAAVPGMAVQRAAAAPSPPVAEQGDVALAKSERSLPGQPALALATAVTPEPGPQSVIGSADRSEPPRAQRRRPAGGPGIILLAQQGDTLEGLYTKLYQGRDAPPYAEVEALNARPLQPGSIVVFPEPPGGWSMAQR